MINFRGWIREEIEHEECGVYVDIAEPGDFVRKINPFLKDNAHLNGYQLAARKLAERKYSRRELSERYCELLREAVSTIR